jgi:hypothetical protein
MLMKLPGESIIGQWADRPTIRAWGILARDSAVDRLFAERE